MFAYASCNTAGDDARDTFPGISLALVRKALDPEMNKKMAAAGELVACCPNFLEQSKLV